jgi:hypothetical protein
VIWHEQAVRKQQPEREGGGQSSSGARRRYPQLTIEMLSAVVFATLLLLTGVAAIWILVMLLMQP